MTSFERFMLYAIPPATVALLALGAADGGWLILTVPILAAFAIVWPLTLLHWYQEKRLEWDEEREEERIQASNDELSAFLMKTSNYHTRKHLEALKRKRAQTVLTDDYGIEDKSKWFKEIKYFVEKVIMPDVRAHLASNPSYLDGREINEGEVVELIINGLDEAIDRYLEELQKNEGESTEVYDETMSPLEYEHYCASLLREQGWEAKATKASGDQGVDVVAEKDGVKVAVQCKKFSQPVGNKAVQEIIAGVKYVDADWGAVVATNGFTRSAKELANKTGVMLLHHSQLSELSPEINESYGEKTEASQQAKEIADSIETIQQFHSLEKELEKAEKQMSLMETEKAYDDACEKCELLQEAVYLAESKDYQWQFMPSIDLDTPSNILEKAYKLFPAKEYQQIRSEIGGSDTDWFGLEPYYEGEEPEPYYNALLKFRGIVEANLSREETIEKIDRLVAENKSLAEAFFDMESQLSPGDQWFADSLYQDGLPLAYDLYQEGFCTPEDCLKIDPSEFRKRKGVGEKRMAQLIEYQAKVRAEAGP